MYYAVQAGPKSEAMPCLRLPSGEITGVYYHGPRLLRNSRVGRPVPPGTADLFYTAQ